MNKEIKLNTAPVGTSYLVRSVGGDGPMRRRLMDLGLVDGARITPLFESIGGDPRAYDIRGAVIALRGMDAELISVAPVR